MPPSDPPPHPSAEPATPAAEPLPGASAAALPAWATAPVLLGALALWLLATLGWRPLLLPDEGRYAEIARAMLQGGAWPAALEPTLNGLPFFHKPPLFYWIDMAAMQLTGSTAFAGRFASALGAWLMGAALYLWLRRRAGPRRAAIALGVLATTPFFFVGAQYANHDMLVGGLITAAVLALARALEAPAPRVDLRWLLAGWALCGLGVLAKGLIGVVLPALVIGPWLLAHGRWRQMLGLLHPLGLLVFVAVAAPWFIAMQWRHPEFFDYFFMEQHFRRFAQSNFNNVHGAWFFVAVLPLLTLPWSGWLVPALRLAWQRRRGDDGFCLWWVVAVIGFFSLPSSKLVGYALPALAPWCALLATVVADGGAPRRDVRRGGMAGAAWRGWMVGAAVACIAIVGVAAWKAPQSNRALARELAARMAADDRVVMVDAYFYDVPFYARLTRPVTVASDWADPDVPRRDNWRKELFDATRFAPALGRELLQPLDALAGTLCGATAVWFIVREADAARLAPVPGAVRVVAGRVELWRAAGRRCP